MTQNDPQVPWTDEQWARVNQVIQEEASRARVAATFLPLYGPLPGDTDFVRAEIIQEDKAPIRIGDRDTIQLATLVVKVYVRGAQMADPEMRSVLALFRRAANVLGRLEDAVVFNGQIGRDQGPPNGAPPPGWEVHGGQYSLGLLEAAQSNVVVLPESSDLVVPVSQAVGQLEGLGYFGPFAVVLDQKFFTAVQNPAAGLVLPQDRIIPFLGGGPLLRSSALPSSSSAPPPNGSGGPAAGKAGPSRRASRQRSDTSTDIVDMTIPLSDIKAGSGVVVALGGAPVELVVARDVSLQFLQLTQEPQYLFRVYEKMALRIKSPKAIVALVPQGSGVWMVSPVSGPAVGSTPANPFIINIWGFNLSGGPQGVTQVKFGDSVVPPTSQSVGDSKITLALPSGTGKVPITVTVKVGSAPPTTILAGDFTYTSE